MNIEEAKKYIRMIIRKKEIPDSAKALGYVYAEESIETILNELDKKDKVIDMMAECIDGEPTFGYGHLRDINTPEKVKKYFYNKIGG